MRVLLCNPDNKKYILMFRWDADDYVNSQRQMEGLEDL